jgi:hypothetical protein
MISTSPDAKQKLLNIVLAKTGYDSKVQSEYEFKLAVNGDLEGLRNSYCKRLKAFKCVQTADVRKRALLVINNLKTGEKF